MALSPEQIDIISNQYIVGLYDQMERDVIADIARRVKKTGRLTETAEIMARTMREQGYSTGDILASVMKEIRADKALQMEIAENTKEYKQMVKQIIQDTEAEALKAGDMLTAMAGDMAWNDDMQMWEAHNVDLQKDNALKQLIEASKKQTEEALHNITGTGKKSKGELECGGANLLNAYQRQMDLALLKVATGNTSYTEAVKQAVKQMARDGVTVRFRYTRKDETGAEVPYYRRYHLDVAARMCIRTGVSQLAGKVTEMNMEKTGQDLVYVDAHAGARPEHAEWQGKVYVYNQDAQKKYPQYGDFWSETDYGGVTGLKGVNCTHNFFPYWEGDVIPEFTEPEPVEIDGVKYTYYEATQEQRKRERDIRAIKRELDATNALGDKEGAEILAKKLGMMYKQYGTFSDKAGLRAKYERTGVYDTVSIKAISGNGPQTNAPAPSNSVQPVRTSTAFDGLRRVLGDVHVDAMNGLLAKCGKADIIDMYERHAGEFSVVSTTHRGTPCYVPSLRGVKIDIKTIAKAGRTDYPYQVMFHEFAHNMDHLRRIVIGGSRNASVNYVDADGKSAYERMREDLERLRDEAFKMFGNGKKATARQKDNMVVRMLEAETSDGHKTSTVSDTLESLNGTRLTFTDSNGGMWTSGHGLPYWSQGEGKASQATLEMFAKYCEACVANPEAESFLRRCFPATMTIFDEMVKVI